MEVYNLEKNEKKLRKANAYFLYIRSVALVDLDVHSLGIVWMVSLVSIGDHPEQGIAENTRFLHLYSRPLQQRSGIRRRG